MKIDHIEEIEALARQAVGEEPKAKSLTKAIVKAAEFWHEEAKDELVTKADLDKALGSLTWRFAGLLALTTALITGPMYYALNDIKNDMREIRNRIPATSAPSK
jgi:hypothetical protein